MSKKSKIALIIVFIVLIIFVFGMRYWSGLGVTDRADWCISQGYDGVVLNGLSDFCYNSEGARQFVSIGCGDWTVKCSYVFVEVRK